MKQAERQNALLSYLSKKGSVSVEELCIMFGVSDMTVRRDLTNLEKQGLLLRKYGGATISEAAFYEISFKAKVGQSVEEKNRIGKAAADMVKDGQTILIDSGSTTAQLTRYIKSKRITVVTNALNVVSELIECRNIEILLSGGILRKGPVCLIGPQADDFFSHLRCDRLFLGVEGLDEQGFLMVPDMAEARTKQAMVKASKEIIVLADSSKLGRHALGKIMHLEQTNVLITGKDADRKILARLSQYTEVITV